MAAGIFGFFLPKAASAQNSNARLPVVFPPTVGGHWLRRVLVYQSQVLRGALSPVTRFH